MARIQRITPCLWFDSEAEPAATFYVSVFPNSRIKTISRYGEAGFEVHRRPAGSVMVVTFDLDGQAFMGLNGGPVFKLTEAVSFVVNCDTQDEVDHYWNALGAGGDPRAQQCRLEGLAQVIDRAGFDTPHDAFGVVQRRDHDDRNFGRGGLRLQAAQDLVAADVRHHHVEQNEVEGFRLKP